MKIIIPMAGRGSRLRPHTLTVPKPLVPIAGKPIVQRLVEDIAAVAHQQIEEIAFIIGDFGEAVEKQLLEIAKNVGAKGNIYHQEEALGTAHAILCAKDKLEGNVVVAFADTLFKADFNMDTDADGVLWVKQIEDPSAFGVVQLDDSGIITDFVEKPKEYVSDLAMIGIYYFKDGANLKLELQYLIDNNIIKGGEYQLPDALLNMTQKGKKFVPGKVDAWLDCGNFKVTVDTNKQVLEFNKDKNWVSNDVVLENSIIVPPCYIGNGVKIENSIVGPHVSLGDNSKVSNSIVKNCLIQNETQLNNANLQGSMLGSKVIFKGKAEELSLGDYTQVHK